MAHLQQQQFCSRVKEKHPEYFKNKKVLDIGSLDLNGSNRFLFEDCNYIGIDLGEGRNVDIASTGNLYDAPDEYFDTIISTEVFEHDMYYPDTIKNVIRMLKPGGMFIFTCAANGRPEHGTRRTSQCDAPLLEDVSEEWADYYKNLEKEDIEIIPSFNETFVDGHFERGYEPDDLYFYGIKGGEKYLTHQIIPEFGKETYKDDIFVIDCWPNNESKENDLIELIKILKIYNIDILLTGHYPIKPEIQKMVDYYLFDKKNPLLLSHEFNEYQVASGRWSDMGDHRIDNANAFHHDYAIWEAMRNSFNFCKYLGKKKIHFFEYDNLPNQVQYRQAFLERLNGHDAVLYEYSENSTTNSNFSEYCATFIFSVKTDVAIKAIDQIKTKEEYFKNKPNGWQLERVFLTALRKVSNNIFVTNYIANNDELNTQAVWNRDGMIKNGAYFQTYIGVDEKYNLHLHLISGFSEIRADKDYLLEVVYNDYKKFITLHKDAFFTMPLGQYRKGSNVIVYYQGVEVYKEFLGESAEDCREINKYTTKIRDIKQNHKPKSVNVHFVDGPYIEILDDEQLLYNVEFINNRTKKTEFSIELKSNHWSRSSIKYYVDWTIVIKGIDNDYYYEHKIDLKNKRVYVAFESKSLGDTIAFVPYVDEFRKKHGCKMICSTFQNDLFKKQYKEIEFVEPGTNVNDLYSLYRLGMFYKTEDNGNRHINFEHHSSDPKLEPLTKIASDILGLDYVELRTKLPKLGKKKQKRVCIGIHSTAQSKYWNNPNGWQDVVDYLKDNGYEVRLLSKEEDGYMGNKNPIGVTQQPVGPLTDVIKTLQESELFIGISSGLSWLAWGADVLVVLISGFTDIYTEPFIGVNRVINKNVCNSCWNRHDFDAGDWNWCPEQKGTDRQFECSKEISSETVINEIKKVLNL